MGFWDGSGISWTICEQSVPGSRQITTSAPHHSIFTGRMLFLMPNQQCQSTEGISRAYPEIYANPNCGSKNFTLAHCLSQYVVSLAWQRFTPKLTVLGVMEVWQTSLAYNVPLRNCSLTDPYSVLATTGIWLLSYVLWLGDVWYSSDWRVGDVHLAGDSCHPCRWPSHFTSHWHLLQVRRHSKHRCSLPWWHVVVINQSTWNL